MAELTILQVVPRLDTGGSEQATIEIAEALTRAGAKALVATAGGRMTNAVTQAGGEIATLPVASKNPFTMLANAKRLESLIKERDVALVHARSRAPAWSAWLDRAVAGAGNLRPDQCRGASHGLPGHPSEIGALPETIVSPMQDRERFTGWLVPAGDAMALADAIHAALALSPEERAAIGGRASARASAEFALSQMQMKTLAVYDELLGTHLAEAFADPPSLAAVSLGAGA